MVLIPCNNEADSLPPLLMGIADKRNHQIVVIDDSSVDETGSIAAASKAEVYRTPSLLGRDQAIKEALNTFFTQEVDYVIIMDGDGQHPPEALEDIEAAFREGKSFINGCRFTYQTEQRGTPLDRVFLADVLSASIERLTGWKVRDPACGLIGLRADLLRLIIPRLNFRRHLSTEIIVRCAQMGVPFEVYAEVPIPAIYDVSSSRRFKKYARLTWQERLIPRVGSHIDILFELVEKCYGAALPGFPRSGCDTCHARCVLADRFLNYNPEPRDLTLM